MSQLNHGPSGKKALYARVTAIGASGNLVLGAPGVIAVPLTSAAADVQWFSGPAAGVITYTGDRRISILLIASTSVLTTANANVSLDLMKNGLQANLGPTVFVLTAATARGYVGGNPLMVTLSRGDTLGLRLTSDAAATLTVSLPTLAALAVQLNG